MEKLDVSHIIAYLDKAIEASKAKGIHSYEHEITNEIVKYVGEPKLFGQWLGITKRIGAGEMKAKLDYLKERGIKNGAYLMKMCKGL